MGGCRIQIDLRANVIEQDAHVWITQCGLDHRRVERGAADRVNALVRIAIVRREMEIAGSRACGMDHAAAHGDGVPHHFVGDAELLERVNPAGRERQVDRAPADEVARARVGPPFVQIDLMSAPPKVRGKQAAS